MLIYKKIRVGAKYIEAIKMQLGKRNLVILKGSKGYIMCGYLNLRVAQKFKDVAIKITGVSTIGQARRSYVYSCTTAAKILGVYKGQPIKEVIKIII